MPTKTFTLLPIRGDSYELDMSANLVPLAFSHPTVAEQAVPVQATQSGELDVTKAMEEAALDAESRKMAVKIGMLDSASMHSSRREAIIEMQRAMSTESARTLANHISDSGTVLITT
ncbi:hypothetical protein TI39_contig357g00030 [Zymoseptoria brevis]|uniref:Uncharacterized protein n=1 Tax=Zymoseptoria brevis TaxID=1047168 RepID=A0A0F4GTD1_9PEZI|nr:hypothetical protein TI39_contig357g00030 [Zymoseptoria brevis]